MVPLRAVTSQALERGRGGPRPEGRGPFGL